MAESAQDRGIQATSNADPQMKMLTEYLERALEFKAPYFAPVLDHSLSSVLNCDALILGSET
jgi:hypothetical protein